MNSYIPSVPFPTAYISTMPASSRETQQQAKKNNYAKQDLMSANVLYNAGLYDVSCILSEQAAEKFLKSCPDIFTPYGHNVIDLYHQFSAVYGEHQCKEDDIRLLKTKFYRNRYGDQPGESSTESKSLQCLQTACSRKGSDSVKTQKERLYTVDEIYNLPDFLRLELFDGKIHTDG